MDSGTQINLSLVLVVNCNSLTVLMSFFLVLRASYEKQFFFIENVGF